MTATVRLTEVVATDGLDRRALREQLGVRVASQARSQGYEPVGVPALRCLADGDVTYVTCSVECVPSWKWDLSRKRMADLLDRLLADLA